MTNNINAYTKLDGDLTRHNIDKLGLHLTTQNEMSKVRSEQLLRRQEQHAVESKQRQEQQAAESKKRDEEAEKRAEKRNEDLLRSNKKLERKVDGLNGLIEEFRAAMTPQKKLSVPTDVTVATAASSVPSIHYRDECVPDGMGGWKN